ncbi:ATP-dependent helicase [Gardnerella pickettii]|uniref:ATP-dependent helicase n=1 Tax=Gardnerella pickettii TaxID=2914924 RepID=UPI000791CAE8|nr:ATP-dependent helicase [Gardnerella pickettii]KXA16999.1 UvrD/REP helicase [Gardnerella pickettii]MDF2277771.1 ATP-dependent helicase [Gardnerella pickettii]
MISTQESLESKKRESNENHGKDYAQSLLEGLDDSQRKAAMVLQGPVRITACAGAGKTRTITRRIAYACAKGEWDENRVLAVTFSVKAAKEMQNRLKKLGVNNATVATFHSAALQHLRRVWNDVCEAPFPNIMDDPKSVTEQALIHYTDFANMTSAQIRDIIAEINWAKVSLIAPDDYARACACVSRDLPAALDVNQFVEAYKAYELEKNTRNLVDFNDLLLLACHVLRAFPKACEKIRSKIGWITVDEYQDVSPLQHELLKCWLGNNRNICVVGDPAQTIYSFAGASSYDLLEFPNEFAPLCADINLNTDYRSTERIVGLANRVLSKSAFRCDYLRLMSKNKGGARVTKTVYNTDYDEAVDVAQRIYNAVKSGKALPTDFAILTRTNAQHNIFCKTLGDLGIHFSVRKDSGLQIDVLENNFEDSNASDLSDSKKYVESGDAKDIDFAKDGGSEREKVDLIKKSLLPVTISTIHASKGLEFKHVFLIGCSEGLLPFGSVNRTQDANEEERRLMYVAITRAEATLHISYAICKDYGNGMQRSVSHFLE